ncbi:MAG: hypothetical protein R3D71_06630 [Rickettsiales bacterium]
MNQPVPDISEDDVKRLIKRDFSNDKLDVVLDILKKYSQQHTDKSILRVWAACVKLSGGNITSLEHAISKAKCDYRDVIAEAEYPLYSKSWSVISEMSDEERKKIIDLDWQNYTNWLNEAL